MTAQDRPLRILLVEDNPIDVLMTRRALNAWGIENNLHVLEDGQEAVDFLYRRGTYSEAERPDLILLDLNLPKKTGIEVLSEINRDADLSTITVVVVTTSDVETDLETCNALGARLCITKPLDFEEYVTAIKGIQEIDPLTTSHL